MPDTKLGELVQALPVDVRTLPAVPTEVSPVPPFAAINVPAKVIAPVVAEEGVNPVVPALNEDALADHVGTPPETVRTVPVAPIASLDRVVPVE
jgi:hypothetical protein